MGRFNKEGRGSGVPMEQLQGWRAPNAEEVKAAGSVIARSAGTTRKACLAGCTVCGVIFVLSFLALLSAFIAGKPSAELTGLAVAVITGLGAYGCAKGAGDSAEKAAAAHAGRFSVVPCRPFAIECGDGTECGMRVRDLAGNECQRGFCADSATGAAFRKGEDVQYVLVRMGDDYRVCSVGQG